MPHTAIDPAKNLLLQEMLPRVPFDGWSQQTLDDAARAIGMTPETLRHLCPRGAIDMAAAYHTLGDQQMTDILHRDKSLMEHMKYREKVAFALRTRLSLIEDKEVVRSASALFALPNHSAEGARLIWGTADAVWRALGDDSTDVNWYTKRATLSAVWGTTVLYWLADESPNAESTAAFIDRRIADLMQVEVLKKKINDSTLLSPLTKPLNALLGRIKAPTGTPPADMPGSWTKPH